MSGVLGFESRLGLGEESTWGTKVAATELVRHTSENVQESSTPIADDGMNGRASRAFERAGPIRVGGQVQGLLRYPDGAVAEPSLLLKHHFGDRQGILYRNALNEGWVALRAGAADNVELAFQLTVPGSGSKTVSKLLVLLRRRNALVSGNLAIEIQGNSGGDPDGTPIANGTSTNVAVNMVTLDDFGQWVEFTFAVAPVLTGGTIYHIVLTGTYSASATDNIEVGHETVGSGGNFEIFDAAWADDATKNMNARLYTSAHGDSFLYANRLTGKGLTMAVDKSPAGVHEHVGCKVGTLTLRGDPDAAVVQLADVIGKERSATPQNTSAILAGLINLRPSVAFTDLNFRIGDQADALDSNDEFQIRDFEFRTTWDLDQINTSGGRGIIEPENAHRTVEFTFSLARFVSNQFHTWAQAGTKLQIRLYFTDGTNHFTLLVPEFVIQPTVDAPVAGAGPLTVTIRGRCYQNTANSPMRVQDEAEIVLANV